MGEESVDVLVIGSGPAGAAVTKRLTDLGAKVLCLEQGDWMRRSDYPSTKPDWEVGAQHTAFNSDPNIRRLPQDYPVTFGGKMDVVGMYNGVGGTLHDGMYRARFRPSDFRARTLDGVADDWPILLNDLVRYYEMDERESGISGLAGDPANPSRGSYPMPPLPIGVLGETMGRGFDKLGWYWWPCSSAIPSHDYDGRLGCVQHGMCGLGCGLAVKATPDLTYWPKALRKGAVLKTWARVSEVTVDSEGRVSGAIYFDRDGNLQRQPARVVVVSCNGIGTPRLLLNSKSKSFPQGLANSSGMVGKNFMHHTQANLMGTFDQRLDGTTSVPLLVTSQQFYETDPNRGFVRGYAFLIHNTPGPLGHSGGAAWGADHHRSMHKRFPHMIQLTVLGEDLPDENNRVELDPDVKDSNGIPAARVVYNWSENSLKMLKHAEQMGRQVLQAAGAAEIGTFQHRWSGGHQLGTARMGSDPKRSVVNIWNQAHDVKNLFIVDGSSFTTVGSVNPTHTIYALALRTADNIWQRRKEWKS